MKKDKILIVDDETSILETFTIFFESIDMDVKTASSYKDAISTIEREDFDVILTDLRLDDKTGLDILSYVKNSNKVTPVILLTAYASKETAIQAAKLGIYDYLTKPVNFDELSIIINRAIEKVNLKKEINSLKNSAIYPSIIGNSKELKKVLDIVDRVSKSDVNVLITGESGTGKELIAKAIHRGSDRNKKPFLPLNCGAIPENLIESELFGYIKGAFTGASMSRDGIFISANRGTIFLDEIAELPIYMQPKLLRVLQEQKVRRIGEQFERDIDVRIIAATNKNLEQEIVDKNFREDLFYRLNVINIEVPPLRKRVEDIPILVDHFINNFNKKLNKNIKGVTNSVLEIFYNYQFPGNIRELENVIERMMTLEMGDILTTTYLPAHLNKIDQNMIIDRGDKVGFNFYFDNNKGVELDTILDQVEKHYLKKALEKADGVKKNAAKLLNISFRSLRYRLDKHNLK